MKILFIEIDYKGHHISLYANKLFNKFLKKNEVFFLTSINAYKSEEFKTLKNLNKITSITKMFLITNKSQMSLFRK